MRLTKSSPVGSRAPRSASTLVSLVLCLSASCGDDPEQFEPLDPSEPQYGKTFGEWAGEWVNYISSYAPPLCDDPIKSTTGASCAVGQDPASPVFFLVGTYGAPAVRTECVVPSDAALFFPLIMSWADTAGLAEGDVPDLRELVERLGPNVIEDSLYATVDGIPVADVQAGFTKEAVPYTVHIPEEPNLYTCAGIPGVVGDFPGWVLGAWVMLPPLGAGKHTINFGSKSKAGAGLPDFTSDVRYELTVLAADR